MNADVITYDLIGSDDATAPDWKRATADELVAIIEVGARANVSGPVPAAKAELAVRQIRAFESAANEAAEATRKLVQLTLAIAALTRVLVALTIVLALEAV